MILPTKHLPADKALLTLGAEILIRLDTPLTISALWDDLRAARNERSEGARLSYGWFVLALDLLFMVGAVEFAQGTVRRTVRAS